MKKISMSAFYTLSEWLWLAMHRGYIEHENSLSSLHAKLIRSTFEIFVKFSSEINKYDWSVLIFLSVL